MTHVIVIHRLKKTTSMTDSIIIEKNYLKLDIRISTLWNWKKNGRHFNYDV